MDTEAPLELKAIYAPIQQEMRALDSFLQEEFCHDEPFIGEILRHIARFRGKQIRPALLFLVHRMAGGSAGPDVVKIAAVIELIHTATLVHDDILDDAELRRRVDTVHRRWGERAGVLIGDFIYSRAFHLSTQVPGMAGLLSETTNTICEGELLQIANRFRRIDEQTYLEVIRKKTAILYAVSCGIGGVLAGLDAPRSRALHEFGLHLGMAFQIADDCLDYAGKESITGKSLGTDLRQGKVTLPLLCLLDSVPEEERQLVEGVLRGPITSEAEEWIRQLVESHGTVEESFARAAAFVQEGKAVLAEAFGGDLGTSAVRERLELVADYVARRQR